MSKMTIGFIPGGTGNGLVKSVLDYSGENYTLENAAFIIAKGRSMRMDLTEIEAEYMKDKIYSFLSTAWAVIADCDINSECLRFLGPTRFTLWGVLRIICIKRYRGSLLYSGFMLNNLS